MANEIQNEIWYLRKKVNENDDDKIKNSSRLFLL